jgi:hypothetical protein
MILIWHVSPKKRSSGSIRPLKTAVNQEKLGQSILFKDGSMIGSK